MSTITMREKGTLYVAPEATINTAVTTPTRELPIEEWTINTGITKEYPGRNVRAANLAAPRGKGVVTANRPTKSFSGPLNLDTIMMCLQSAFGVGAATQPDATNHPTVRLHTYGGNLSGFNPQTWSIWGNKADGAATPNKKSSKMNSAYCTALTVNSGTEGLAQYSSDWQGANFQRDITQPSAPATQDTVDGNTVTVEGGVGLYSAALYGVATPTPTGLAAASTPESGLIDVSCAFTVGNAYVPERTARADLAYSRIANARRMIDINLTFYTELISGSLYDAMKTAYNDETQVFYVVRFVGDTISGTYRKQLEIGGSLQVSGGFDSDGEMAENNGTSTITLSTAFDATQSKDVFVRLTNTLATYA